jgi:hypothetical protein
MRQKLISVAVMAALAVVPAQAVVLTGSLTDGSALTNGGAFQIVTPIGTLEDPYTVGRNNIGDNNVRVFNEKQIFTLTSDLAVRDGVIAAGTRVASQFLFFDPRGAAQIATGFAKFNGDILGVATTTTLLQGSDFLGIQPTVFYNYNDGSGLEDQDIVTFSGRTLNFTLQASSPSDSIRILTAVPEPASWAMLIAGFGLVGAAARRRRASGQTVLA